MRPSDIHPDRISELNTNSTNQGEYVLYWMQQSQRSTDNHALEYSVKQANELNLPLLVCFGLWEDYPEAQERHFCFMLEGLAQTGKDLEDRGISFVIRRQHPLELAVDLSEKAAITVCDKPYLRHLRDWRRELAETVTCKVVQVESELCVPVEVASTKQEYAARTIRRKLMPLPDEYAQTLRRTPLTCRDKNLGINGEDHQKPYALLADLNISREVGAVSDFFKGGQHEALTRFKAFTKNQFSDYCDSRLQPETGCVSHMGMYLQYGQISPRQLLEAAKQEKSRGKNLETFVEELVVRRELQHNFVYYNERYDDFETAPEWARESLEKHADDPKPHSYTASQFEDAETHDRYWNAAMQQMKKTGYMHNYMRMYWGKKILQWASSARYAHSLALKLNNKYLLDGMNANTYGNILWLFGLHDRGWGETETFGKVRSMTAGGLERKCNIEEYASTWLEGE